MNVIALDHFNIKAPERLLERIKTFYIRLLDLKEGFRPSFPGKGAWLYAGESPLLHLSVEETADEKLNEKNCLDHIALRCRGMEQFMEKLRQMGVEFTTARVPGMDLDQIFLKDPAGIGIELNFIGESDKI